LIALNWQLATRQFGDKRLALALALDNRSRQDAQQEQMAAELAELRRLIQEQSENVGRLTRVVERTEEHLQTHPTLLYSAALPSFD